MPASRKTRPGHNQIIPAWFLTDSLYTLARNETKFRTRHRSRRASFEFEIFRLAIIDQVCDACTRLETVRVRKRVYLESDIAGLGCNYLLEKHRQRAIEGYRLAIQSYALRGLLGRVEDLASAGLIDAVSLALELPGGDARWEHQRRLLRETCGLTSVRDGLCDLRQVMRQIASQIEQSKAKDDERGRLIIDDYADAHLPLTDDPVIRHAWTDAEQIGDRVNRVLAHLPYDLEPQPKLFATTEVRMQVG
jgi:hypothetical protein